ncbi:dolichyl-phosphate-mannose--protein mannosyltransferase [Pseudonocardia pini]|uniref:dolichyl-phosphate-mannose--protein mannosyltransferase n=1 Tax=Pseudonocardia pini TaxID=2758030 RepID=UPI0015F099A9
MEPTRGVTRRDRVVEPEDHEVTGAVAVGTPPPLRAPEPDPVVRLGPPMPTDTARGWVLAVALALLGGVLRFTGLGYPTDAGTPVFDEKHYVPQAWQMLRNGGVEDNPGYELVAHPPLGKQLIAVGEWIFGYDPLGWRAAAAFCGTLMILMIVRVGRRLTRSTLLGGIAGVLLICDGVSHVQARVGMLDVFQAFFVLAAFCTLVRDRDDVRERLGALVDRVGESPFGPVLGVRWWRIATGVLLGLGCGVKWSGVYWIVFFGVLSVLWDVAARRSAGVARPWVGAIRRDLLPALGTLALLPVLTYLACWWAWFGSEVGIDRHVVGREVGTGGSWAFVPDALRSLWYYSGHVLDFHESLDTPAGQPHPWESKPWTWPMGLRPMLYFYESGADVVGCEGAPCTSAVMLVGTPALWWPAIPVLGWALWRSVTRADWRYVAVLVGYGAGFLPWFVNIDRQMYFFYMTPVAPFLVLATVLVMGDVLGRAQRAGSERRQTGLLVVGLWVGAVVANFAWLWPILVGLPISPAHWQAELWLPSWR